MIGDRRGAMAEWRERQMVGAGIEVRARRLGDLLRRAVRYHRYTEIARKEPVNQSGSGIASTGRCSSAPDAGVEGPSVARARRCCVARRASVSDDLRQTPAPDEVRARGEARPESL
jgi:hypothetical protein